MPLSEEVVLHKRAMSAGSTILQIISEIDPSLEASAAEAFEELSTYSQSDFAKADSFDMSCLSVRGSCLVLLKSKVVSENQIKTAVADGGVIHSALRAEAEQRIRAMRAACVDSKQRWALVGDPAVELEMLSLEQQVAQKVSDCETRLRSLQVGVAQAIMQSKTERPLWWCSNKDPE